MDYIDTFYNFKDQIEIRYPKKRSNRILTRFKNMRIFNKLILINFVKLRTKQN